MERLLAIIGLNPALFENNLELSRLIAQLNETQAEHLAAMLQIYIQDIALNDWELPELAERAVH